MKQDQGFFVRQLRSLCAMALLSPTLRLIPGAAAAAGRPAWAGPLAALPLLLVYAWLLWRMRQALKPGEELPQQILQSLGRRAGRLALLLLGLWLLLYCGFTLRAGAERFLVTVYPRAPAWFFVVSMGLLALPAGQGSLRRLTRVARMVEPVLLAVLGLILLTALRSADMGSLLPLTPADAGALARSALPSLDVVGFGLAAYCLLCPGQASEEKARPILLWTGALALLLTALGAAVQGRFGSAVSARLSTPFFALVRNLTFFRSLERMEALVVGLWIFPDFLLAGLALQACRSCLLPALDTGSGPAAERRLAWPLALAAVGLGLLLAPDGAALQLWSQRLIPGLNLAVAALLPAVWGLLRLRKRL